MRDERLTPENREYFEQSRTASAVPLKVKDRDVLTDAAAILRTATKRAGEDK